MIQLPENLPNEITIEGKSYPVTWSTNSTDLIVGCKHELSVGEIVGFGVTVDDAINDLHKAYKDLVNFANDCKSEWWKETYHDSLSNDNLIQEIHNMTDAYIINTFNDITKSSDEKTP